MSLGRVERIVCPKCGGEDDFVVWQSINTMTYPEVKQEILSGEIFLFKCPKCATLTNIKYDCLYHQMESHLMILVVNNDESVSKSVDALEKIVNGNRVQAFQLLDSDYTFRIVRDNNQLREKIYIFDHGLDDRVIEMMKIHIVANMLDEKFDQKVIDIMLYTNDNVPKKFVLKLENGKLISHPFEQNFYDTIKDIAINPDEDSKRLFIVNLTWACNTLNALASK